MRRSSPPSFWSPRCRRASAVIRPARPLGRRRPPHHDLGRRDRTPAMRSSRLVVAVRPDLVRPASLVAAVVLAAATLVRDPVPRAQQRRPRPTARGAGSSFERIPRSARISPVTDGLTHVHSGKVRDLYRAADGRLVMVASDRISAFDYVLDRPIPDKGRILTAMSVWWFAQLARPGRAPRARRRRPAGARRSGAAARSSAGRCEMLPVEAVARGYLTGSGLLDYQRHRRGVRRAAAAGLRDGDRLPEPIFTPATKAALGEHDENVSLRGGGRHRRGGRRRAAARADAGRLRPRGRAGRRRAASCWPTPSSSSAGTPPTARSCSATRCSPPTPRGSGRPTTGSRAGRNAASTSSTCATGCCRMRPGGTARSGAAPRPRCRRSRPRHPRALRRGLRAAHRPALRRLAVE